jgi:hypothetical protein
MKKSTLSSAPNLLAAPQSGPERWRDEDALFDAQNYLARHYDDYSWHGEGEEPLFYPVVVPHYGKVWQMAERLYELRASVKRGKSKDIDVLMAKGVLRTTIDRAESSFEGEPTDTEDLALEAYRHFFVPFAEKLSTVRGSGSRAEAEKVKQQALHWVSEVIDNALPITLQTGILDLKCWRLITWARDLCYTLDRLPKKKELWDEARKQSPQAFTIGEDVERIMLKKAGLDGLPQARRGGK